MNTITDYIGGRIDDLLHSNSFLLDGGDKWVTPQTDEDFVGLIDAAKSLHHEWVGGFLECYDSDIDAWAMYYVTASLEGLVCDIVPVPDRDPDGFDPDGVDFPDRAWSVEALERYIGDHDAVSWLNLDVWGDLPTAWQVDGIIRAWAEREPALCDEIDRIVADPYYAN